MHVRYAQCADSAAPVASRRVRAELRALFGRCCCPNATRATFPSTIAHYELLKELGAGSRGVVYLARDRRANRFVAVKILPAWGCANRDSRERFMREAACLSALSHPNIAAVYEMGQDHDVPFIAMEYLPGRTLNRVIPERGLPLGICVGYALQMARAIAVIHGESIIHRDLKPSNFWVAKCGAVKLLDFGLAKWLQRPPVYQSRNRGSETLETLEGTILGTASYMSPEQVRGQKVDRASDIFSFGVVFQEMLTGRRPFRAPTTIETMSAILREAPTKLPQRVPAPIAAIVLCCLEKKPNRRYKTAAELLNNLLDTKLAIN